MAAEGGVEEAAAVREQSSPSSSPMRPAEHAVVQRDGRPQLELRARTLAALVARSGSRQERDISWRLGRREGRGDRGGDVWMRARDRPSLRSRSCSRSCSRTLPCACACARVRWIQAVAGVGEAWVSVTYRWVHREGDEVRLGRAAVVSTVDIRSSESACNVVFLPPNVL